MSTELMKRAEEPCLQDGLCLEVVGYLLYHRLCNHKRAVNVQPTCSGTKLRTFPETSDFLLPLFPVDFN